MRSSGGEPQGGWDAAADKTVVAPVQAGAYGQAAGSYGASQGAYSQPATYGQPAAYAEPDAYAQQAAYSQPAAYAAPDAYARPAAQATRVQPAYAPRRESQRYQQVPQTQRRVPVASPPQQRPYGVDGEQDERGGGAVVSQRSGAEWQVWAKRAVVIIAALIVLFFAIQGVASFMTGGRTVADAGSNAISTSELNGTEQSSGASSSASSGTTSNGTSSAGDSSVLSSLLNLLAGSSKDSSTSTQGNSSSSGSSEGTSSADADDANDGATSSSSSSEGSAATDALSGVADRLGSVDLSGVVDSAGSGLQDLADAASGLVDQLIGK